VHLVLGARFLLSAQQMATDPTRNAPAGAPNEKAMLIANTPAISPKGLDSN